jgi:predicted SprT family Zn-dependent metalloprotease
MEKNKSLSYDGQFTKEQFGALQNLYDYFNRKLFAGELGPCLLNLSRKSKSMGFYSPGRWVGKETTAETKIDEISLSPDYLHVSVKEYCQTLVHEMCHKWQHQFGKPTPGYHNKEFAEKMKSVGLMPSHNGQPGGKEIGKKMADYSIEGGVFEKAFSEIPEEMLLPFIAHPDEEKKKKSKKKNKVKYTCPMCNANAWGKRGLLIHCGECSTEEMPVQFEEETPAISVIDLAEFTDLIENA